MGGVLNDLWDLHRPELCEDNQQQRHNLPTRVTFVDSDEEDNQRRERISSVTFVDLKEMMDESDNVTVDTLRTSIHSILSSMIGGSVISRPGTSHHRSIFATW